MGLHPMSYYGIGQTPLHHANHFCPEGKLMVKLESRNRTGSSKDRLAYALLDKLPPANSPIGLFDSTSGNFGIAMADLAPDANAHFMALIDKTTFKPKIDRLRRHGAKINIVPREGHADERSARINAARQLEQESEWVWTNQYDNPIGIHIHAETTGPEIWEQTQHTVDTFVCSVGTGATICGVGAFLKDCNPAIKIVAVEPYGSTIFGGATGCYLNAGAGMLGPTGLTKRFGQVIDYYCKVPDSAALYTCREFARYEFESIGITGGAALHVGQHLSRQQPGRSIVVLIADAGDNYGSIAENATIPQPTNPQLHCVSGLGYRWWQSE